MKKLMGIFVIMTILVLAACGSTSEQNESESSQESTEKPSLNIGYVSILANAPGIVADKQGLFNEKLNATTYGFNSGPELYQALAAGELDVAYAGVPALVNWASRGLDVEVIAKVSEGQLGVVVSEQSDIKSVDQLKGEVIAGVKRGSGVDIITRGLILPKAGLSDTDVTIQEFKQPNIEAAVETGQASAGVLNEPFLTYALLRGKKQIVEEKDPALVVLTTKDALENKTEAVQAFIDVHKSTTESLNEANTEINQTLVDVFNIESIGDTVAEDIIKKAKENLTFSWEFNDDDFVYYQQLADAAYELGYIEKEVDTKSLFNLDFVEGVKE
ncbi:ABC transporter substrate-binding protein [Aquibacillus salsiterrae]|uniref:ABC transporter substrate-binding protein n=1 Tax=Aquibacillus salsiterrae TaxID=2950439 RepID=A0A9X3WEH9_9BACI|nr:ABC transporter substrate-binding protein [Aquibacillus salsiterrae]MDC3417538.1 ABC transporter substrate-binding protein [Aquibacillus salsiterrae]